MSPVVLYSFFSTEDSVNSWILCGAVGGRYGWDCWSVDGSCLLGSFHVRRSHRCSTGEGSRIRRTRNLAEVMFVMSGVGLEFELSLHINGQPKSDLQSLK